MLDIDALNLVHMHFDRMALHEAVRIDDATQFRSRSFCRQFLEPSPVGMVSPLVRDLKRSLFKERPMKSYFIGTVSALVMCSALGIGPVQSEPMQGASPSAQPQTIPATPPNELNADRANQVSPPQTTNSEVKGDKVGSGEPGNGVTLSEFYNQDVYDTHYNKIGSVKDGLLDQTGQVTAVILGVGGVLGIGEKDVSVPFNAIRVKIRDGERYLVTDTSKEALQEAPAYTYDRALGQWVPTKQPG
jgi:sporulation protein YlmC with PRC-barrel domain